MTQSAGTQGAPQPKHGASYHDYAGREPSGWRRLLASPRFAAAVLVVSVLFGTLYGSHRSLQAARPAFHGTQIEQLFEMRGREGFDLITVATRYPAVDSALIDKTRDACQRLTASAHPGELLDANLDLTTLAESLMTALEAQPLSDRDAKALAAIRADLAGQADQISRHPYHLQAQRFNNMLQNEFPANVLAPLTGVEPAEVF